MRVLPISLLLSFVIQNLVLADQQLYRIPGGWINSQGELASSPSGINPYQEFYSIGGGNLYRAKKNWLWGLVSSEGEVVAPFEYSFISNFSEGFAVVEKDSESRQVGYIDSRGKEYALGRYDSVSSFSDGLAIVATNKHYGAINGGFEVVIPLIYDYMGPFKEGMAVIASGEGVEAKMGYIERDGRTAIPCKFHHAKEFRNGLAAVAEESISLGSRQSYLWGLINVSGKYVITPLLDTIKPFAETHWIGEMFSGHRYFLFDRSGMLVFTAEGVALRYLGRNRCFLDREGGGSLLLDIEGSIIAKLNCSDVGEYREGLASFYSDGFYGFIDERGKEAIPGKYRYVQPFSGELALVHYGAKVIKTGSEDVLLGGGHWQYVDKNGDVVWQAPDETGVQMLREIKPFEENVASSAQIDDALKRADVGAKLEEVLLWRKWPSSATTKLSEAPSLVQEALGSSKNQETEGGIGVTYEK